MFRYINQILRDARAVENHEVLSEAEILAIEQRDFESLRGLQHEKISRKARLKRLGNVVSLSLFVALVTPVVALVACGSMSQEMGRITSRHTQVAEAEASLAQYCNAGDRLAKAGVPALAKPELERCAVLLKHIHSARELEDRGIVERFAPQAEALWSALKD